MIPIIFIICHNIIQTFWLVKSHRNFPSLVLRFKDHNSKKSPEKWKVNHARFQSTPDIYYQGDRGLQWRPPGRDRGHRSSHKPPRPVWAGGWGWGRCWGQWSGSSSKFAQGIVWPWWRGQSHVSTHHTVLRALYSGALLTWTDWLLRCASCHKPHRCRPGRGREPVATMGWHNTAVHWPPHVSITTWTPGVWPGEMETDNWDVWIRRLSDC